MITRRDFLAGTAQATAATAAAFSLTQTGFAANEDKQQPLAIIDTHQHLWDLSKFKLPWLADQEGVLKENHTPETYREHIKGTNITKSVYMEVDVAVEQQVQEAEYVTKLCKAGKTPTVAAVISGRPAEEAFGKYIGQFKDNPYIKGVRQVLFPQKIGLCLEPQFVKNMKLLGELGLSFDLCMRATRISDGFKLAMQCPDTQFILDHCGNADPHAFGELVKTKDIEATHQGEPWKKDIAQIATCENVICKISGIVARAPEHWKPEHLAPIVDFCLDEFGPDRVVFGSDWPVCRLRASLKEWVDALLQIIAERPRDQQEKLLSQNAQRIYTLKS